MSIDTPRHLIIINAKQLRKMVPYTRTHIGRLERAGRFPKRVRLGLNRVGWLLVEVEEWINALKAARPKCVSDDDQFDLDLSSV